MNQNDLRPMAYALTLGQNAYLGTCVEQFLIDRKAQNMAKGTLYFYSLAALSGAEEGYSLYYPLYTIGITSLSPYLRTVGNSENTYLSSIFWRKLKNVLTDQNYYNKQIFDIPHVKGANVIAVFLDFKDRRRRHKELDFHLGKFIIAVSQPGPAFEITKVYICLFHDLIY